MRNIIKDFEVYQVQLKKSNGTIKSYVNEVELFTEEFIKGVDELNKIEKIAFAREWLDKMNERYAPGTVNKKMNAILVFGKYLVKNGHIKENAFSKIDKVKNNDKKFEVYKDSEIESILQLLEDKTHRQYQRHIDQNVMVMWNAMFSIYINAALRNEEVTRIEINDLDFETGILLVRCKGHKGKISHKSKLNKSTLDKVKIWYEIRKAIVVKEGSNLLFVSPLSKKGVTTNAVRKQMKNLKEELGINNELMIHSLRHTRITELVSKGASIEAVSQFAHHSSISTTERFYIHSNDKMLDELSNM